MLPPQKINTKPKKRLLAPGVKAGRELMAALGGIPTMGTQQRPYYYFPLQKRLHAGVDRCNNCDTTHGLKSACHVQALVRIGPNLYKSMPCHECIVSPDVFENHCSLDGKTYVFDGDARRLLTVDAKGNVTVPFPTGVADTKPGISVDIPPSTPLLTATSTERPVRTPDPILTVIRYGLPTPSDTPVCEHANTVFGEAEALTMSPEVCIDVKG